MPAVLLGSNRDLQRSKQFTRSQVSWGTLALGLRIQWGNFPRDFPSRSLNSSSTWKGLSKNTRWGTSAPSGLSYHLSTLSEVLIRHAVQREGAALPTAPPCMWQMATHTLAHTNTYSHNHSHPLTYVDKHKHTHKTDLHKVYAWS